MLIKIKLLDFIHNRQNNRKITSSFLHKIDLHTL